MLIVIALMLLVVVQPAVVVACGTLLHNRRFVGVGVDRFTQTRGIASLQFSSNSMEISGMLFTFDMDGNIASRTMDGVFDLTTVHGACSIAMHFSFESHDLHYIGTMQSNGQRIDAQNEHAKWQLYAAPSQQTCTMQTLAAGTYAFGDLHITLDGSGKLEYKGVTSYEINANCQLITTSTFMGFVLQQDNAFVFLGNVVGEPLNGVFHRIDLSQTAIKDNVFI